MSKLARALKNFISQSYENKYLIVVCNAEMKLQKSLVEDYKLSNLQVVFQDASSPINKKIYFSKFLMNLDYQYICVWDENEWSHPDRISHQVQSLKTSRKSISVILHPVIYNSKRNMTFLLPGFIYLDTALFDRAEFSRHSRQELEQLVLGKWPNTLTREIAPVEYAFLLIKIYGDDATGATIDKFYETIVCESDILPAASSERLSEITSSSAAVNEDIIKYISSSDYAETSIYIAPPASGKAHVISFNTDILFDHSTCVDSRNLLSQVSKIKNTKIWKCRAPKFSGAVLEIDEYSFFGYRLCGSSNENLDADEQKKILKQIEGSLISLHKAHDIKSLNGIENLCLSTLICFESIANYIPNSVSMVRISGERNITHFHAARGFDIDLVEKHLKQLEKCNIWRVQTSFFEGIYAEHAGLAFFAFFPKNESDIFYPDRFNQSIDSQLCKELIEYAFSKNIDGIKDISHDTFNDLIILYSGLLTQIAGCDFSEIARKKIYNTSLIIRDSIRKIYDNEFSEVTGHLSYFSWVYYIELAIIEDLSKGNPIALHDVATNTGHFPCVVKTVSSSEHFSLNASTVDCSDINISHAERTIKSLFQANEHSSTPPLIGMQKLDLMELNLPLEHYDIITANDIIEHFEEQTSFQLLGNILINCSKYLIVHVPIEENPTKMFGHLTTFSREKLKRWGTQFEGVRDITEKFSRFYDLCPDHTITDGFLILEKI